MQGNDRQFLEAIRLIRKFFPEAASFICDETGTAWELVLEAMQTADYHADYSCDPFRRSTDPDLGLAHQGGLEGLDDEVYERLLLHTVVNPEGRVVVLPDAISAGDWSYDPCLPFVCHSSKVSRRLCEASCFAGDRNTVFVFENGHALLVDHDGRVHWSRSRIRRWTA